MKRTPIMEQIVNVNAKRTIDELEAAIKAGDMEKALELHRKNVTGKQNFHDFAVRWVNLTLSHFKKNASDEAIFECMKEYATTFYPPVIKDWISAYDAGKATYKDFPLEGFLENRANLWQMVHDNEQIWEEDDEKITFILDKCNSGGYLVKEQPDPVAVTDEAHTWCYDKKGFQCYCLNCTTMWEFGWYEWFGWPLFIMDVPGVGSDGKCVMTLYKDPKDIPDAYYEKRGLKRKI
ncbi:MAG: hypothetical protein Q8S24_13105 [Eubacteriales bacterium]|nr:hypothetical protein [Eubacteriales bacterium]